MWIHSFIWIQFPPQNAFILLQCKRLPHKRNLIINHCNRFDGIQDILISIQLDFDVSLDLAWFHWFAVLAADSRKNVCAPFDVARTYRNARRTRILSLELYMNTRIHTFQTQNTKIFRLKCTTRKRPPWKVHKFWTAYVVFRVQKLHLKWNNYPMDYERLTSDKPGAQHIGRPPFIHANWNYVSMANKLIRFN